MKFNPNQRYTRWSIRRLSVGVASVVVASGFFVLVDQPSSARADVVNPTPFHSPRRRLTRLGQGSD